MFWLFWRIFWLKSAKNVPFLVKSGENICKYGSFVVLLQHKYCDKG